MLKFNLRNLKQDQKVSYEAPRIDLRDYGSNPFTIDLSKATKQNNTYRLAFWTGEYLQLTLMCINPGEDIGLEVHPDTDQFFWLESGKGKFVAGNTQTNLNYKMSVSEGYGFVAPAGKWHNFINTGSRPAKLFTIYAPPHHPFGTVHRTKRDAEHDHDHGYNYHDIKKILSLRKRK